MIAYSNLEPWGPLAEDFRFGQVCATVANVNRDPERRAQPFLPSDFMPPLAAAIEAANPPELPADPQAHADLLDRVLFGGMRR